MADDPQSLAAMLARPSFMDPAQMVPARPEMRAINPTLQQHLTNLAQRTVGPQWADALEPIVGMLPLVGVEEGYRQSRSPDPLTRNLGGLTVAAGIIPGIEGAGEKALVGEGAKAAEKAATTYSAEHLNAFKALADAQRHHPELAMVQAQKELSEHPSGNTLGHIMEHVGDLTHRMSQEHAQTWNWGREWVEPKVRNQLRNLQNVVDRDRMARIPVTPGMKRYADEHAKLPVYNRAQQLSRDAAVAVGRKDFDAAEKHLTELKHMLDTPGAYEAEASKYDPHFEKSGKGEVIPMTKFADALARKEDAEDEQFAKDWEQQVHNDRVEHFSQTHLDRLDKVEKLLRDAKAKMRIDPRMTEDAPSLKGRKGAEEWERTSKLNQALAGADEHINGVMNYLKGNMPQLASHFADQEKTYVDELTDVLRQYLSEPTPQNKVALPSNVVRLKR